MPSQYSSEGSVVDAKALAINLGIKYEIIAIESVYKSYADILQPYFAGLAPNVTEENIQARIRGMLLMAFSNKFGSILLNTTNKSEMAVGYGTMYGDLCGGLAVLADVYKTQVYELAHYVNRNEMIIPQNSITKPPSAELRPGQRIVIHCPIIAFWILYFINILNKEKVQMKSLNKDMIQLLY